MSAVRYLLTSNVQPNAPGVYAIGDLVRGPMLAHKGSEEGRNGGRESLPAIKRK
jgi:dihydrolipoamide dehydrogenase